MGLVTTTNRAGDGRSWTNDPKERTMTKTAPKRWLLWGRKTNTAGGRRIKVTAGPSRSLQRRSAEPARPKAGRT